GFVPSRNPALAMIVVVDSPHGPAGYHGGAVAAPIFQRIADAALRNVGVPPNVNAAAPVLVARRDAPDTSNAEPKVTLVTEARSDTVPDVRGMSAREAIRTLFRVGLNAHVSGDGVVVSQTPPAGAPIEAGVVCRLVLDRSVRRA